MSLVANCSSRVQTDHIVKMKCFKCFGVSGELFESVLERREPWLLHDSVDDAPVKFWNHEIFLEFPFARCHSFLNEIPPPKS